MPTPDDRLDAIDNIKEKISLTVQESVEILGGMISDFCENSLRDVEYRSPIILMKGTKRNHGPLLPQSEKILSNLTYNIGKIIMTGGLLDQLTTCSMSASKNKACSFVKLHHNFHKILANLLPVLYPTQCKERQMKHFKEDWKPSFTHWICQLSHLLQNNKKGEMKFNVLICNMINDTMSVALKIREFLGI